MSATISPSQGPEVHGLPDPSMVHVPSLEERAAAAGIDVTNGMSDKLIERRLQTRQEMGQRAIEMSRQRIGAELNQGPAVLDPNRFGRS